MKTFCYAMLALGLATGFAQAQSMNKKDDPKQTSPGATGAMGNVNADGVATDPGGVAAQSGKNTKGSPGTVGAAPDGAVNSSQPAH